MKNEMICLGLFLIIVLALSSCTAQPTQIQDGKLKVIATFYPLYDLTKKIAGEKADVNSIVPAGVEPHDYEPTPSDILKLSNADAFVTIGLQFSGIENKLIEGSENKIFVIDSKKEVALLDAEKAEGEENLIDKNNGKDSHIWLSPGNMIIITGNIRDGLKNIDPANSKLYDESSGKIIEDIKKLDSEYKSALSNCSKKVILTNHRAFAYLGKDYGFSQIGIFGLMPETEPTPKEIVRIKDEAIKNDVKYIFIEDLVDARVAETIAKEIGAKTLVLNPIEGIKNPVEDYFSIMRENLAKLRVALECS